jgi:hypothetical protein
MLAQSYAKNTFTVLAPNCSKLFTTFAALWVIWQLGINWSIKGDIDWTDTIKTFLIFLWVGLFLQGSGYYWEWIYEPIQSTTLNLAQTVIKASGQGVGGDIQTLLNLVETELNSVFDIQSMIAADTSWYQVQMTIGGLIVILPFVFIWGLFLALMLTGVFTLMAMTALAPVYIVCAAFSSTRPLTIMALRVILCGCLTVILTGVAMGFTLSVLKHYMATIPVNAGAAGAGASTWVFSKDYWALFLIGFISILFHLQASSIASSLAGASAGAGAAGLVVASTIMAAGIAKNGVGKAFGWGAEKTGGFGTSKMFDMGKNGLNQISNSISKYNWPR